MLEIRNIEKSFTSQFGSQRALSGIDLTIRSGEFFSLLGPSGCGKSTLLRVLAGLESADRGEIRWAGQRIDGRPARERPFNMVFQKYALFPHLSVFDNVAFALKIRKVGSSETAKRVRETLDLVNLSGFEKRLPETLSGGQAQRVALARALVSRPACLLLDESLTALDQQLREHMQSELRLLQKRLGLTFVFVTHDQEEAMLLSDRVAVMNEGRIEQVSAPRELYESPQSAFCARFIGRRNELLGQPTHNADAGWVDLKFAGGGRLRGRAIEDARSIGAHGAWSAGSHGLCAFIRPEKLRVLTRGAAASAGSNLLEGEVIQVVFRGVNTEVVAALGNGDFLRALTDLEPSSIPVGTRIGLEFSPEETHVFAADRL